MLAAMEQGADLSIFAHRGVRRRNCRRAPSSRTGDAKRVNQFWTASGTTELAAYLHFEIGLTMPTQESPAVRLPDMRRSNRRRRHEKRQSPEPSVDWRCAARQDARYLADVRQKSLCLRRLEFDRRRLFSGTEEAPLPLCSATGRYDCFGRLANTSGPEVESALLSHADVGNAL